MRPRSISSFFSKSSHETAAFQYTQLYKKGLAIPCTTYIKVNLIYDLRHNPWDYQNYTDIFFYDYFFCKKCNPNRLPERFEYRYYRNRLDQFWKINIDSQQFGLHRCWWRMLETKCVGDNFEILVTVLVVFVGNILYLLTWASLTTKRCQQYRNSVTNIRRLSPI